MIRPGVQGNGKQSAQKLTADGATRVCFTLEDARTAARQELVTIQTRSAEIVGPSDFERLRV